MKVELWQTTDEDGHYETEAVYTNVESFTVEVGTTEKYFSLHITEKDGAIRTCGNFNVEWQKVVVSPD